MKKILIVSDAWEPQVNGVVTTLTNLIRELKKLGHAVDVISTSVCKTKIPTPYPDVYLGLFPTVNVANKIQEYDYVHIATPEGSIGNRFLKQAVKQKINFTTGYHTKWPEFLKAMFGMPEFITYWFMKRLHRHSSAVMVPTDTAKKELEDKGFSNVCTWTRGVDRSLFKFNSKPKNYLLCVSRISKEKGLDDFCNMDTPLEKIVVGDGPYLEELKQKYADIHFVGVMHGKKLVEYYRNAACFVFPSKADTFGVVMIEAMACGTPVAAYPVTGPLDVIDPGITGVMDNNLINAVHKCVELDRKAVCEHSKKWTWENCAKQFLSYLAQKS